MYAWEFVRNDAFDANDFFRQQSSDPKINGQPGKLRLNTFGFNAGGPVTLGHIYNKERNRTFFFYNMEWRKMIQQGTINAVVPDKAWYTGNLSSLLNPALSGMSSPVQLHVPSATQLSASELARWAAAGYQPGQAITNNQIPASMLSANAQALLAAGSGSDPERQHHRPQQPWSRHQSCVSAECVQVLPQRHRHHRCKRHSESNDKHALERVGTARRFSVRHHRLRKDGISRRSRGYVRAHPGQRYVQCRRKRSIQRSGE